MFDVTLLLHSFLITSAVFVKGDDYCQQEVGSYLSKDLERFGGNRAALTDVKGEVSK